MARQRDDDWIRPFAARSRAILHAQEEWRYRATHDPLTGIPNRGVVLDALEREHARQMREATPYAFVVMDLDHFKYVNDTYGHQSGDDVLKEAAKRAAAAIRPYDTVGSYGGEEFLVVASAADEAGATGLAERIRLSIQSASMASAIGPISIAASFGLPVSPGDEPIAPGVLIQKANEALYLAKERRRNHCELAVKPPVEGGRSWRNSSLVFSGSPEPDRAKAVRPYSVLVYIT